MKALILGERICQIEKNEFPVAKPLRWVEVPDDTTTQDTFVNGKVIKYVPETEETQTQSELEKKIEQLSDLLQEVLMNG
jgi:DNA primase